MLLLRIVQLTLLTLLAFGSISTVFSAPLTAQAQQELPTTIPDLSGYDSETRQSIELACILKKSDGPVAYGRCLNRQIASLQSAPGIANLSGHDSQTQQAALPTSRSAKSNSHKLRTGGTAVHSVEELVPFIAAVIILFIYLGPVIWVLLSGRSRGGAKFGWFIVTLLFSWIGLAVFLIATQGTSNRPKT
jgi:hypothetical protein